MTNGRTLLFRWDSIPRKRAGLTSIRAPLVRPVLMVDGLVIVDVMLNRPVAVVMLSRLYLHTNLGIVHEVRSDVEL